MLGEIRNPKAEIRKKSEARNPKSASSSLLWERNAREGCGLVVPIQWQGSAPASGALAGALASHYVDASDALTVQ